jgi:hypothetical protein
VEKMKYAYVHRLDLTNPGDLWSCPQHYFGEDSHGVLIDTEIPPENIPQMNVDVLIVGGGAVLSGSRWVSRVETMLDKIHARHRVIWGAGAAGTDIAKIKSITANFNLVGLRDYNLIGKADWVPCVSVFHRYFRQPRVKPKRDFLVIDHFKRPVEIDPSLQTTRIINKPNSINTMLELIDSHRVIVTASYHAAYWATLLNKKVIVMGDPIVSKFQWMKHPPVLATKWTNTLLDQAISYPDAYEECKTANADFYKKFRETIGLPMNNLSWMG